jgi:thioredoxin reductase (NADPH)
MDNKKLIIIGSGPAGYTAAIYAARADLAPVLFTGQQPGGQLMLTSEVENWPGEADGVMGPDLMEKLKKQAIKFGTQIIDDTITAVDFSSQPFKVTSTSNGVVEAESIIISTGASAKWLGIPGEQKLQGRGVSACATCDGFFFRDKKIVVVGGGDSAMEEATFLTKFASSVTVIVRGDKLRASKIMQEKAQNNPKISFLWNTSPTELIGEDRLTGVKIKNSVTAEESVLDADGFFVAIGHQPNTRIFIPAIEVDAVGYIKHAPDSTATNIPGVFACGDVIDSKYRQAVTAAGSGCMAALQAERWLAAKE